MSFSRASGGRGSQSEILPRMPAGERRNLANQGRYTPSMLFMVTERFRHGDPLPVRARFRERGRMLPDGVTYHGSWIDPAQARCFQIMEANDAAALQPWIDAWADIVEFEVVAVLSSADYWAKVEGDLRG